MTSPRAELLAPSPHYDDITGCASECARPDLLWAASGVPSATPASSARRGRGWVSCLAVGATAVAAVLAAVLWLVLA